MPEYLLAPFEITGFVTYPVTLEAALVKIAELETQVETANNRFIEIRLLQRDLSIKGQEKRDGSQKESGNTR